MPTEVLLDCTLTLDSVVYDQVTKLAISQNAGDVDLTSFGDGWERHDGGIKKWSFAADITPSTTVTPTILAGLLGRVVPMLAQATSDVISTDNPQYSGNVLITEVPSLSGSPGDRYTLSITGVGDGELTIVTTPI